MPTMMVVAMTMTMKGKMKLELKIEDEEQDVGSGTAETRYTHLRFPLSEEALMLKYHTTY